MTYATDEKYEKIYFLDYTLTATEEAVDLARLDFEGTSYNKYTNNCHGFVNSVLTYSGHSHWAYTVSPAPDIYRLQPEHYCLAKVNGKWNFDECVKKGIMIV